MKDASKEDTVFILEGDTPNGTKLINNTPHALIGISPFNSRFSEYYI